MLIADVKLRRIATLILILLGITSLLLGVVHLTLCGYFWNSAIGIWNAVIVFALAIYIARIRYGQAGTIGLILFLSFLTGLAMLSLGIMSIFFEYTDSGGKSETSSFGGQSQKRLAMSSRHNSPHEEEHWGFYKFVDHVRLRILERAVNATRNCENLFDFVKISKFRSERGNGQPIPYIIYGFLTALGSFQIFITCFIFAKLRYMFVWEPELAHLHILLGFISIIAGAVHVVYCCRYYYMISGLWAAGFCIAAGLYHTRTNFPYRTVVLLLNLLSLVAMATMASLAAIGLTCWNVDGTFFEMDSRSLRGNSTAIMQCLEEKDEKLMLARLANGNMYKKCFNGLDLMGYWSDFGPNFGPYAWPELKLAQIVACGVLVAAGICDVMLSVIIIIKTLFFDDC